MKKTEILDAVWAATFVRVLSTMSNVVVENVAEVLAERAQRPEALQVAICAADAVVAGLKDYPR